jgi:hypothetical protein
MYIFCCFAEYQQMEQGRGIEDTRIVFVGGLSAGDGGLLTYRHITYYISAISTVRGDSWPVILLHSQCSSLLVSFTAEKSRPFGVLTPFF